MLAYCIPQLRHLQNSVLEIYPSPPKRAGNAMKTAGVRCSNVSLAVLVWRRSPSSSDTCDMEDFFGCGATAISDMLEVIDDLVSDSDDEGLEVSDDSVRDTDTGELDALDDAEGTTSSSSTDPSLHLLQLHYASLMPRITDAVRNGGKTVLFTLAIRLAPNGEKRSSLTGHVLEEFSDSFIDFPPFSSCVDSP